MEGNKRIESRERGSQFNMKTSCRGRKKMADSLKTTTTTTTATARQTTRRRTHDWQSFIRYRARSMLVILASLIIFIQLISPKGSHLVEANSNTAVQSILLDTTEQNSLGWTKYPDGGPQTRTPGWVEESFTNFEHGINWRSFVVCDVAFNSVNNWLWTPFIERGQANRLYIEIKFTMRDCNLFPSMVLSCKETFALLYKETDSPIQSTLPSSSSSSSRIGASNASFAESDSYTLIDAIAADEGRFTSNTDVVINTEVRSIPVSKRGVYFAFRDQGACLSLISIKVYHLHCPQLSTNFAQFNATPTGRDLTSLVAVEGSCVPNSLQIEQPKMFCTADGNWNAMSSGQCKCLPGFEPAANQTKCQACPPGKFKSTLGDLACQATNLKGSRPQQTADFGLSAHQSLSSSGAFENTPTAAIQMIADYANGFANTNSSIALSGPATGGKPTTTNNNLNQLQSVGQQSSSSWLGTSSLWLCALILLVLFSMTLIHYRKTNCMQSLGGGFAGGSTYGGVYGTNVASGLMGDPLGFGSPLGRAHHHHHHATLSASSAGGLITGSNNGSASRAFKALGTSCSSSGSGGGAGSVVQNFIAATFGARASKGTFVGSQTGVGHTMGGDGKLFASATSQQQQRNHYHQTLSGMNLNGAHNHLEQVVAQNAPLNGPGNNQFSANNQPLVDPFKYRTLAQPGAQFGVHQDPQMHIYDDLDNTCASMPRQSNEIDPQRVRIESVIGRGEFGDVCLASLRSNLTGLESRVAVKTLKAQANDKAKLDFLVEASIMSQFEHPNIIRLEGVVTKSEPPMIVCEFMEKGSLDCYLRDNKNRFTCLQLISMLRGVANGMQYLAKLNYVHKDLAARNILVNGWNVCKIADFGLSAHQSLSPAFENTTTAGATVTGDYTTDSTSTNSSNTLSSQATGSTPTTASTMAGSNNLNQLQTVAEQIAQQRFNLQLQQQPNKLLPTPQQLPLHHHYSIQNQKIPVRWTALEAIAFRRFSSASDVWSYGIVCWEVMTQGERPYSNWSNQDVIKAVEQGYRLPQPDGCPEQLYKMMLDCWLKDRAARPTFSQILITLDRLLSPYEDPFCQLPMQNLQQQQQQQQQPSHIGGCSPAQQPQLVPMHTRISSQDAAYYDTYNPISQLINNKSAEQSLDQKQQSVDEWLSSIKMSRYRENFNSHQINSLQYVARLNQADLNLIGIQNGQHVKKILNAIAALRTTSSIGSFGEGYLV